MNIKNLFLSTAAVLPAMGAWASAAYAQDHEPAPSDQEAATAVDEVVVTGSRIVRDGFSAPTPVTVVSAQQLQNSNPGTLADAVAQLPTMRFTGATATAAGTGAGSGASFLNLRGLGSSRTLTLLDGRRFVPATGGGGVDVNLMPTALVERVEVVTGGASAAYGSDAVSGVTNFILNRTFEGLRGEFQTGVSDYGDNKEVKLSLAGGMSFAGGRGHLLGSIEGYTSDGVTEKSSRPWQREGWQAISNPNYTATNGETRRLLRSNVRLSRESYGGLITSGPFRGTTFGPDGQPLQFNYGELTSNNNQVGGDGPENNLSGTITSPLNRASTFLRGSYDVNDDLTVYAEAVFGLTRVRFDNGWSYASGGTGLTIMQDNAFLPQSLADAMRAQNVASVPLGVALRNYPHTITYGRNWTQRYVTGADFNLGQWRGEVYYEWGRTRNKQQVPGNLNLVNFYNAVDAVRDASGRIVCRSTLTDPTNGCAPFNVFGEGNASAEAVAYAFGESSALARATENVAAVALSGEPISLWAGPVSVATGLEWRKEQYDQVSDPLSQTLNPRTNTLGVFRNSNPQPQEGEFSVTEGFVEVVVPLAQDMPFARSAELNTAYRIADYSLSGRVDSWKVGLTYKPVDDVTLRFTRSRDVRAPNLSELFLAGNQGVISVRDPFQNGAVVGGLRTVSGGNTALTPELADTLTYGVVYSPSFIPGLTGSIDYYDIDIQDAIGTLGAQLILDQCYQGVTTACSLVTRDAGGNLLAIRTAQLNLASVRNQGLDIEGSYRLPLSTFNDNLPGDLTLRVLGNRVLKQESTTPGAAPIDRAGDMLNSTPKWRWTGQATVSVGEWTAFVQARYVGGGVLDVTLPSNDIDQGYHIPSATYVDARVSYDFGTYTAYFAVNNLLNKDPLIIANNGNQGETTNSALHDRIGRMFRVGLTFTY